MFNARSETLETSSVFNRLLKRKNRCVVFMDGFYEWKKDETGQKQPYYMSFGDRPIMMAGLYDVHYGPKDMKDAMPLPTVTIITTSVNKLHLYFEVLLPLTQSNESLSWLHDRMPVILDEQGVNTWLDHTAPYKVG